jgi:hypothetical protein
MVFPLLLLLASPAPSPAAATAVRRDDPPVKVWLDQGNYRRGDKAHVNIKLGEDGYVVVLRADADRRVRVLFPLDPGDDAFVRGGPTIEVRGRGDREAFSIDEREGSGLVLAARSVTPFQFDEFTRGDHWDYRVLTTRDGGDDQEQALLDLVQRMVPDGHFDRDAVHYTVASPRAYYDGAYSPYSSSLGLGLGYGFGGPRTFSFSLAFGDPFFFRRFFFRPRCFDPFFFDPFFCDPFFFDPFFFHRRFFFPRVFVFSRTAFVFRGRTGVVAGFPARRGLLIEHARPEFRGRFMFRGPTRMRETGPRLRVPTGALRSRTTPATAAGRPRGIARAPAAPIGDRRQRTVERPVPSPAARAPERVEFSPAWRAAQRPREPGWGRASIMRDRGFSVDGVSGRTFVRASRAAGSLRRGGGRRR